MDNDQKRQELLSRITTRRIYDEKWGKKDFRLAQWFTWSAILGSFGSAIASATGLVSPLLIAICTAIPGTVIVIEKSFLFARKAQWHWSMEARLQKLENALMFEDARVDDISKQLSDLHIEMWDKWPSTSVEGLEANPKPK